jgi:putative membrane protein
MSRQDGTTTGHDRRFPRRVYGVGEEPDPRFTLANERTFLAWIRTSLAFLAAGVALEAVQLPIVPGLRIAASIIFVALGILAPVQAWFGWARNEQALRTARPLPASVSAPLLGLGAAVAGALLLIGLLAA